MENSEINHTCPHCGKTEGVAAKVREREVASGKMGLDTFSSVLVNELYILDPRLASVTVPKITAFFDICSNCFTVYCVHYRVTEEPTPAVPGWATDPGQFRQES